MTTTNRTLAVLAAAALAVAVIAEHGVHTQAPASAVAAIDDAALRGADSRPGDWLTHGRTYAEQRFSPLAQINESTVGELGLAWSFLTDHSRGHEATPIVVDGVMYLTRRAEAAKTPGGG